MRGRAAKFAYNPADVVAFLDDHTTYEMSGSPARRRRLINGHPLHQDIDARIIRRWRSGQMQGVTRPAAKKLFVKVGLSTRDFERAYPNAILHSR